MLVARDYLDERPTWSIVLRERVTSDDDTVEIDDKHCLALALGDDSIRSAQNCKS